MRLKYPHIAIGAVAASAPILQFEDIVPTDTFYRIVSADFKVIIFPLIFTIYKKIKLNFFSLFSILKIWTCAARKFELFRLHPTIVGCHRQD